jgi:hypothetical protein
MVIKWWGPEATGVRWKLGVVGAGLMVIVPVTAQWSPVSLLANLAITL